MPRTEAAGSIRIRLRDVIASRMIVRRPARPSAVADPVAPVWPTPASPLPAVKIPLRRRSPWLSTDRLIGLGAAAAIHLAVLFLFNTKAEPKSAPAAAPPDTPIVFEMPLIDPPEPVEVTDTETPSTPTELAPPTLMDMPSIVTVSAFMQPMRPTLDSALTNVGALTIPSMQTSLAGGAAIQLFNLEELDHVPRRLRTVTPTYPINMRRARIQGEVVLLVIIDPTGHVEVERVLSSTTREFEVAARTAAEQCLFEPPTKAGQRVHARYSLRVPFELK
jgi:periplasmic protein TonB